MQTKKLMSDNDAMIVLKDLQRRQCSESGKHKLLEYGFDPSFEVSASKRARVSPGFINLQNESFAGYTRVSSLFGLKLEISNSFLDLVRKKLCKGKSLVDIPSHQNQGSYPNYRHAFPDLVHKKLCEGKPQVDVQSHQNQGSYPNDRPKTKFNAARSSQQKLKASNFAALLLKIGSWQKQSLHEECLTAKLYYAKRRMVWEVLEGDLKSKIQIEWSDIMAIRASMADTDEPGILEIQLAKQPLFFRENIPQPRRHTSWAPVPDFTRGQATITRRHLLVFPPGVLDRHYEQLLTCDKRLFALSQLPFPYQECPLFDSNLSGLPQHSLSLNGRELGFESMFIRPSPNSAAPADNNPTVGIQEPVPVMNRWQVDTNPRTQGDELLSYWDYRTNLSKLDDSENGLLWNNVQVPCPNEETCLDAEVEAMIRSYLDLDGVDLHKNNLIETNMACDITDNNLEWLPSGAPNEGLVMMGWDRRVT